MARLTSPGPTMGRLVTDRWIGLGLVVALVTIALLRIALGGWAPLAADDARYLHVGLSILGGDGPVNPDGDVFLLRSPVYGLALALGSSVLGGDPIAGARVVAVALALFGLFGALRLGWLLAGPGGAVGTAFALVGTALLWRLLPSLRIDLPQTAAVVATLLAVWRPTARRWALGGVLLGIAILIKETALPLLLLPVGLVGFVPAPRVARLATVFIGAAILTAAWWWIVVWLGTGQVFPLNALSVLEARDVTAPLRVARSAIPWLVAAVPGCAFVAWRARRESGARLLLVAGLGLVPAALYALRLGLDTRNLVGLAVFSTIAIGVGGASLVAELRDWMATRSTSPGRTAGSVLLAGLAVFALGMPVIGQRDVGRMAPDHLSDELAGWLAANVPDGGRVVMAFRDREVMALRRFGQADVAVLPIARVDPAEALEAYLWMGLRDRQLFGYRRAGWTAALTEPAADVLVLVGPHPFTPSDLIAGPVTTSRLGLSPAASLEDGDDRAEILRVDAVAAATGARAVPLHLSAAAAMAWLDLVGGDAATARFAAARPIVTGDAKTIPGLVQRLGDAACTAPDEATAIRFGPPGSCPD
ncbi:MAG: hypothetical protein ABJC39_02170 [Chloroflexota bacterium]